MGDSPNKKPIPQQNDSKFILYHQGGTKWPRVRRKQMDWNSNVSVNETQRRFSRSILIEFRRPCHKLSSPLVEEGTF